MKLSIKTYLILVLPFLLFTASPVEALNVDAKGNLTSLNVDVYTATGTFQEGTGRPFITEAKGELFLDKGFIPTAVAEGRIWTGDLATLNAISGKPVVALALWTQINEGNKPFTSDVLKFFPRSAETYSIGGVPYVIVSSNPGGGAGSGGNGGGASKLAVIVSAVQPTTAEGGSVVGRFLIALDAATNRNVKVVFNLSGKARNGKDFVKIQKNVEILAGNVSAFVDIEPVDDTKAEGTETVTLKLRKTRAYRLGPSKSASVSIADND